MTSRFARGRNFEYRIINALRKEGFYCLRSYHSKGTADIIAAPGKSHARTLLIQAKYAKRKGLDIPKKEVQALIDLQSKSNAYVVIIHNEGRDMMARIPGTGRSFPFKDLLESIRAGAPGAGHPHQA